MKLFVMVFVVSTCVIQDLNAQDTLNCNVELEEINGVLYVKNDNSLYSGIGRCESGKEMTVGPIMDGKWHGKIVRYTDGVVTGEATYENGEKHGLETIYDQSGRKTLETVFEQDETVTQLYFKYFKKSDQCKEVLVEKGSGTNIAYYKNGQVESETPVNESGQTHGLLKWYSEDGQLLQETPYENGEIHGTEKKYNADGSLKYTAQYEYGKIVEGSTE